MRSVNQIMVEMSLMRLNIKPTKAKEIASSKWKTFKVS